MGRVFNYLHDDIVQEIQHCVDEADHGHHLIRLNTPCHRYKNHRKQNVQQQRCNRCTQRKSAAYARSQVS